MEDSSLLLLLTQSRIQLVCPKLGGGNVLELLQHFMTIRRDEPANLVGNFAIRSHR
jgi:hypothetical protein